MRRVIFVFGSNLAGVHGAGSAKEAVKKWGASKGVGFGPWGDSYAIPTKDTRIRTLPLSHIKAHVSIFLDYANQHPDLDFHIVDIGCGLAGYKVDDIKPLFKGAPANCKFLGKLGTNG
jgi:hypothetical protein